MQSRSRGAVRFPDDQRWIKMHAHDKYYLDPGSLVILPANDYSTDWMDEGPTQPLEPQGTLGVETMECLLGAEKPLEGEALDLAQLHDELFRAANRLEPRA